MEAIDYMAEFEKQVREADSQTMQAVTPEKESTSINGKAQPKGKRTHSEMIVDFLEYNRGERFKASEIGRDLGFSGVYVELQRLHESGAIFKDGKCYYLPAEAKNVDPFALAASAFNVEFPLEIGAYARVSQGDVVLIAGTKNSGKSAFLAETAILNMDRQLINFIITENMRKIAERYLKWGYTRDQIMARMVFKDCRDRKYDSVIDPNSINVLDYFNPADGDYTKTAQQIESMAKRLESGILILGVQKKRGAADPRGGELAEELSQLSIILEGESTTTGYRKGKAKLKMIKEEGQVKGGTGKSVEYTFSSYDEGSRIVQVGYWAW